MPRAADSIRTRTPPALLHTLTNSPGVPLPSSQWHDWGDTLLTFGSEHNGTSGTPPSNHPIRRLRAQHAFGRATEAGTQSPA
jgi:hypothetical protein